MKIMFTSRVCIPIEEILRSRGLGSSSKARKWLAGRVADFCLPYVPKSDGSGAHLLEQYTIAEDGSYIQYHGPYAHYQYMGEVMVGIESGSPWAKSGEKKRGTGKDLVYTGAPLRGKAWDKRMWADRGGEIIRDYARKISAR